MIRTTNTTKNVFDFNNEKRKKLKEYEQFHKNLFIKEGVKYPKFYPRKFYNYHNKWVIPLYKKEISNTVLYMEFCDINFNPSTVDRILWKWIPDEDFETKYESLPNSVTKELQYLIPIDKLINVTASHNNSQNKTRNEIKNSTITEDSLFTEITLKDLTAILWKKPVSDKVWLNKLITNNFK